MPWIFLVLVLVNIGYFGWNFFVPKVEQPGAAAILAASRPDQRLSLVTERRPKGAVVEVVSTGPLKGGDVAAPTELVDSAPVVAATGRQCYWVGPYAGVEPRKAAQARLLAGGFVVRDESIAGTATDYWVFFPAFVTRDQAEIKLAELRRRGVDSFIVNDGAFVNAISLGHFAQAEKAQAFMARLQGEGWPVEMRSQPKAARELWLYVAPGRNKDSRVFIDRLIGNDPVLKRRPAPCEG